MGWFRSSAAPEGQRVPTFEERLAAIGPGVPGHCPSCDGLGYIDDLDLGHRYQIQHCKTCGHRWEYLFDRDGHVVGLTELDDAGQPVARMRVRRPEQWAEAPDPEPEPAPPVVVAEAPRLPVEPAPVIDLRDHDVIDLRDTDRAGAAAGVDDRRDPDRMSPAEWLRHAVRR